MTVFRCGRGRSLTLWMLALGLSFASVVEPSAAAELEPNGRGRSLRRSAPENGPLPPGAISPHYLGGKNLSEAWNFIIQFPNGYFVNCQFSITNVGPIDGTGLMIAYIHPPDGEPLQIKNSRGKKDWQDRSTDAGPILSIARHELEIKDDEQRIHLGFDEGTLDLELRRLTEPLRSGRLWYSDKQFFDLTIFAPRSTVRGTYVFEGETIELENGRAVSVHLLSNLPEHKQASATFGVHAFSPGLEFSLFELTATGRYGFDKAGVLMLFDDDRLVAHFPTFERSFPSKRPDGKRPEYPIPQRVELRSEAGEIEARAQLDLVKRSEILSLLNSRILRGILGLIAKPVLYQFRTEYELEVERDGVSRSESGQGVATLYVSSKPPASY